jgi:hypothetical protein
MCSVTCETGPLPRIYGNRGLVPAHPPQYSHFRLDFHLRIPSASFTFLLLIHVRSLYIFFYALHCTLTLMFTRNSAYSVGRSRRVLYNLSLTQTSRIAQSVQCSTLRSGFRILAERSVFLFSLTSTQAPDPTQPPIQRVPGSILAIKRLGQYADPSTPSTAEIWNGWSYTSAPPM